MPDIASIQKKIKALESKSIERGNTQNEVEIARNLIAKLRKKYLPEPVKPKTSPFNITLEDYFEYPEQPHVHKEDIYKPTKDYFLEFTVLTKLFDFVCLEIVDDFNRIYKKVINFGRYETIYVTQYDTGEFKWIFDMFVPPRTTITLKTGSTVSQLKQFIGERHFNQES